MVKKLAKEVNSFKLYRHHTVSDDTSDECKSELMPLGLFAILIIKATNP